METIEEIINQKGSEATPGRCGFAPFLVYDLYVTAAMCGHDKVGEFPEFMVYYGGGRPDKQKAKKRISRIHTLRYNIIT